MGGTLGPVVTAEVPESWVVGGGVTTLTGGGRVTTGVQVVQGTGGRVVVVGSGVQYEMVQGQSGWIC